MFLKAFLFYFKVTYFHRITPYPQSGN